MDGELINLGDTVYDLVYQEGVINEVSPDFYRAKFKNGVVAKYIGSGVSLTLKRRTLYWHNPIVYAPPKNTLKFNFIQNTLGDLAQSLKAKL